jgi:DnaJ-class molecular chaperone
MSESFYNILGVEEGATKEEIKKATNANRNNILLLFT